jgi:hypothetical protein
MRFSSSMGVEAAALTHPPTIQDSTVIVHNSRRCNQQSDSEQFWTSTNTQGPAGGPSNIYGSARHHDEQSRKMLGARSNN